jgi:predicted neuraminidase
MTLRKEIVDEQADCPAHASPVSTGYFVRWLLILLAFVLACYPVLRSSGRAASSKSGFAVLRQSGPSQPALAQAAPFFREEIINSNLDLPMAHVASICELPGGRLAAAWYAGSKEGARDVAIYFATRDPDAVGWSSPRAIVTRESAQRDLYRPIKKVGNAVLFSEAGGRLWLLYVSITFGGWSGSSINLTKSEDGGLSWAPSRRLTLNPLLNLGELVKNGPVSFSDGTCLVPIYQEIAGRVPELLWLQPSANRSLLAKTRIHGGRSGYQPAIVSLTTNSALAVMRDFSPRQRISIARTDNAAQDWSAPVALDLPNPDSGLAALRLMDGRVLLIFNDSITGRENLRLAVSMDEGGTWRRVVTLDQVSERGVDYPFVIQTQDGLVHVVYSWKMAVTKHVVFNTNWLDTRSDFTTR